MREKSVDFADSLEMKTKEENAAKKDNAAKKEVQDVNTPENKYKAILLLGIFLLILGFVFVAIILPVSRTASEIGNALGKDAGTMAGIAVGSFRGITEEIPKGWEEGKKQGLSAEDTEVNGVEKIEEIGRLEVLVASVRLDDHLKIADDYDAIYVYMADAVFTVDLKNAEILKDGGKVTIRLEKPAVDFYINEEATEKVAEWQKHFYSGRTADGYEAYINSRTEIEKRAPEEIRNYDTLISMAKESAKNQIGILAKAACGEDIALEILFADEEE